MLALVCSHGSAQTARPSVPAERTGLTPAQIAARSLPASVTIVTFDAAGDTLMFGSGFILRSDGVVVTNWHVLRGASRAAVIVPSGEAFERVGIVDGDSLADVAILKFPALGLPILSTSTRTPPPGTHLVVIGAPLGLMQTVSDGILSAVRIDNGREVIQMSAAISPGSSGGPVIDPTGKVIGISRSSLRTGQQLNFAVPIRYALALLPSSDRASVREIADVFGDVGSSQSAQSDRTSASALGGLPRQEPTRTARTSIAGAYSTRTLVLFPGRARTTGDTLKLGILVLDDEGEGWFQSNVMQSEVLYAYDAVSTPTGRVGLKIGRIPIEGYQTDAGLRLEGRDPQSDAYVGMIATQSDFPLSVVDGVYDVRVETRYHGKNYVGQAMPWQGTVAVVGTADSLKLNLKLSNSQGGNAGAFIQTRNLGQGAFDWRHADGKKRAQGRVSNGRISFYWYDERDGGAYFDGQTEGRRR